MTDWGTEIVYCTARTLTVARPNVHLRYHSAHETRWDQTRCGLAHWDELHRNQLIRPWEPADVADWFGVSVVTVRCRAAGATASASAGPGGVS